MTVSSKIKNAVSSVGAGASNRVKYGVYVPAAMAVSGLAAASEGGGISGAINSAVSDGQSNVSTVVVGVVGLAALGFGISMIVSMLRR